MANITISDVLRLLLTTKSRARSDMFLIATCAAAHSRVMRRACPVKGSHLKVGMNLWIVDQSLAGLACVGSKKMKKTAGAVVLQKKSKSEGDAKHGLLQRVADGAMSSGGSRPPARALKPRAGEQQGAGEEEASEAMAKCRICQRVFKNALAARRYSLCVLRAWLRRKEGRDR